MIKFIEIRIESYLPEDNSHKVYRSKMFYTTKNKKNIDDILDSISTRIIVDEDDLYDVEKIDFNDMCRQLAEHDIFPVDADKNKTYYINEADNYVE